MKLEPGLYYQPHSSMICPKTLQLLVSVVTDYEVRHAGGKIVTIREVDSVYYNHMKHGDIKSCNVASNQWQQFVQHVSSHSHVGRVHNVNSRTITSPQTVQNESDELK